MNLDKTGSNFAKDQSTSKLAWKNTLLATGEFIKSHKKLIASITSSVAIIITAYFLIPVIPIGNSFVTNLGAEVRLQPGQIVNIKTANASIKIVNFNKGDCPSGQQCFGAGKPGVEYQMTVDGQKYAVGSLNTNNLSKYRVETVGTDYKTYATVKIVESN